MEGIAVVQWRRAIASWRWSPVEERRCEVCQKPIPPERLEALPETRRCVECAREKGSDVFARRVGIGMDIDTYKDLLGATRS